ncbi:MAG: hypothetical protein MK193_02860 [Lentisphaeria bacterium]|nr:hypothetical protein [Lentisphaeria bacterium]
MVVILSTSVEPVGESHQHWIQLSCKLMLVIAAISEYKLSSINKYFDIFDMKKSLPLPVFDELNVVTKDIYTSLEWR